MPHGRRLVRTEEENFQAWLEKNWDRPLSDEVERLQDALKRLESTHAGDIRRLRGAESEWWRLLRIAFVVCLGLVALLLWYIDRYSETKSTLASADAEHVRFRAQSTSLTRFLMSANDPKQTYRIAAPKARSQACR